MGASHSHFNDSFLASHYFEKHQKAYVDGSDAAVNAYLTDLVRHGVAVPGYDENGPAGGHTNFIKRDTARKHFRDKLNLEYRDKPKHSIADIFHDIGEGGRTGAGYTRKATAKAFGAVSADKVTTAETERVKRQSTQDAGREFFTDLGMNVAAGGTVAAAAEGVQAARVAARGARAASTATRAASTATRAATAETRAAVAYADLTEAQRMTEAAETEAALNQWREAGMTDDASKTLFERLDKIRNAAAGRPQGAEWNELVQEGRALGLGDEIEQLARTVGDPVRTYTPPPVEQVWADVTRYADRDLINEVYGNTETLAAHKKYIQGLMRAGLSVPMAGTLLTKMVQVEHKRRRMVDDTDEMEVTPEGVARPLSDIAEEDEEQAIEKELDDTPEYDEFERQRDRLERQEIEDALDDLEEWDAAQGQDKENKHDELVRHPKFKEYLDEEQRPQETRMEREVASFLKWLREKARQKEIEKEERVEAERAANTAAEDTTSASTATQTTTNAAPPVSTLARTPYRIKTTIDTDNIDELLTESLDFSDKVYSDQVAAGTDTFFLSEYIFPVWGKLIENRLFIAFRGTYSISSAIVDLSPSSNPEDNLVSTYFPQLILNDAKNVMFHYGFLREMSKMYQRVRAEIDKICDCTNAIYVTGHSAGGALATLFALLYSNDKTQYNNPTKPIKYVVTFGSPRCVMRETVPTYYANAPYNIIRVWNTKDIVTYLPFNKNIVQNQFHKIASGYEHVGKSFCLDEMIVTQNVNLMVETVLRGNWRLISKLITMAGIEANNAIQFMLSEQYKEMLLGSRVTCFSTLIGKKPLTHAEKMILGERLFSESQKSNTWQEKCAHLRPYNLEQYLKTQDVPNDPMADFTIASLGVFGLSAVIDLVETSTRETTLTRDYGEDIADMFGESMEAPTGSGHGTAYYKELLQKLINEQGKGGDLYEAPRGHMPTRRNTEEDVEAFVKSRVLGVVDGQDFRVGDVIEITQ